MNKSSSSEFEQEEFKKNLAKYEEMVSTGKSVYLDADQLSEIAEYYASLDDYSKSMETIDYSLKIHPGSTELLTLKAHLLIETYHIEEAKEVVDSISENYSYGVMFLKALLSIKKEKITQAEKIFKEMEDSEGKSDNEEDYYLDAAYAYMDNGYSEKALPWFEKALKIIPDDNEVQQDYAECCFRCGEMSRAITWYNKVLDEDPYSIEAWFGLGKSYFISNDFPNAIEAFDFILAIEPDHRFALILEAGAYAKLKNDAKASELYARYCKLFPDEPKTYVLMGICYLHLKEYEKAKDCFEQAIEKDPEMEDPLTISAYQDLAFCYLYLKEYESAIKTIDKAIELDVNYDAELYITKGSLLLEMNNSSAAKDAFTEALELDSFNNPDTYLNIALVYQQFKDFDAAINILKFLQEDFPDYNASYIHMAYLYLEKKDKINFNKYFSKAVKYAPDTIIQYIEQLDPQKEEIKRLLLELKQALENIKDNNN